MRIVYGQPVGWPWKITVPSNRRCSCWWQRYDSHNLTANPHKSREDIRTSIPRDTRKPVLWQLSLRNFPKRSLQSFLHDERQWEVPAFQIRKSGREADAELPCHNRYGTDNRLSRSHRATPGRKQLGIAIGFSVWNNNSLPALSCFSPHSHNSRLRYSKNNRYERLLFYTQQRRAVVPQQHLFMYYSIILLMMHQQGNSWLDDMASLSIKR